VWSFVLALRILGAYVVDGSAQAGGILAAEKILAVVFGAGGGLRLLVAGQGFRPVVAGSSRSPHGPGQA
jgi:hypothetical protein